MLKHIMQASATGVAVCLPPTAARLALVALLVIAPQSLTASPPSPQFGFPTSFPAGAGVGSLLVADLRGNGSSDVIVTTPSHLLVLTNLGNGTLSAPTQFSGGVADESLVAGDFNNDGKLDIVALPSASSGGHVYLGDGNGGFSTSMPTSFPANYASGAASADFDLDGNLDLAWIDSSYGVRVALGTGGGNFSAPSSFPLATSTSGSHPKAADPYGTGNPSILLPLRVFNPALSNSFCVLSNSGAGTLASPVYYKGAKGEFHPALETGNFAARGLVDVAVLNYYSNSVTIWTNSGRGAFAVAQDYAVGFSPSTISKSDLNQDGVADLLVRGSGGAAVLVADGTGAFTVSSLSIPPDACYTGYTSGIGDFNSDGSPDLALLDCASGSVTLLYNQTPPTIRLTPLHGFLQLDWPASLATGFTLEYTTNVVIPSSWQPFPYPPVRAGGLEGVTDWLSAPARYYRLRK